MNIQDRFDFFKALYEKEFDRKDKIEERLNLPITIIIAIIAFIYFLLNEFDFKYSSPLFTLFKILLGGGVFFLLIAIICTTVVYFSKTYRAEPYANKLNDYLDGLRVYWDFHDATNAEEKTKEEFLKYISDLHISQTTDNTKVNDTRTTWLTRIKMALIISIVFLVLSLFPFYFNFFNKPDKTYKIQLTQSEHTIDSLKNIIQVMNNQNSNNQPNTSSPAPTKPAAPPERLIREGREIVERPSPPKPSKK